MTSKVIEIRDSGTFIPALAIQLGSREEAERYLLSRAGFGRDFETQSEYIVLCKINGGEPCECHIDPHTWDNRTMVVAHLYLLNRHREAWHFQGRSGVRETHKGFDCLTPGAVIDVEYILGLRETPKISEAAS